MHALDVDKILAKATEAAREGRAVDSRKLARYALSLDPDHPRALFRWAVELLDEPEQAAYYLRRAAELAEGDAAVEYQVASVLLDLGRVDESLHLARRAGSHVEDECVLLAGFADVAAALARFLAREGRGADAVRVVHAALEHAPEHPELLRLRDEL
jgi:tetratricopeptide (TPR) repeat protein